MEKLHVNQWFNLINLMNVSNLINVIMKILSNIDRFYSTNIWFSTSSKAGKHKQVLFNEEQNKEHQQIIKKQ